MIRQVDRLEPDQYAAVAAASKALEESDAPVGNALVAVAAQKLREALSLHADAVRDEDRATSTIRFVSEELGITLYSWQEEIMRALFKAEDRDHARRLFDWSTGG